MKIYALLIAALAIWAAGLWLRGFFGPDTSSLQRRIYFVRNGAWFMSIFVIAWPLQVLRERLGNPIYIFAALVVLVLFYLFGYLFARQMKARDGDEHGTDAT